MHRIRISAVAVFAIASFTACGSDKGTGPAPLGKPVITQVNGVTEPVGLIGMTVMIEGASLGDLARGKVYFRGTGGARIQATVANADWTDAFIVTTVPQGTADSSKIWVETTGGVSDSISFTLISSGLFSPSNITWSTASALPQPLQGLGAVAVRIGRGSTKGSWVYTVGGADPANVAGKAVYRAPVMADGGVGPWSPMTSEPAARAYHTVVAATPSTARIDTTVAAYVYALGGVDAAGATVGTVEFTRVGLDGGLTAWQSVAALPTATAYHSMVSFGPFVYVVGGDNGTVAPTLNTLSGSETNAAYVGRIDMRNGTLPAWAPATGMGKARSKGAVVAAGGSLLVSSGIYAGQAGSSENTYASITADGSLASWNGATGPNTIDVLLGYAVYNTATVFFLDAQGRGHVMLLGGANRSTAGQPSAAVVYY